MLTITHDSKFNVIFKDHEDTVVVTDRRTCSYKEERRLPAGTLMVIVSNILAMTNLKYQEDWPKENAVVQVVKVGTIHEVRPELLVTADDDTVALTTSNDDDFDNYNIELKFVTGNIDLLRQLLDK